MADDENDNEESKYQHETPASTPNSSAPNASQVKAPKDRHCPFCAQAFTSSSLGRHLDLYVRPKNPKPPDGVHDVSEIRKLRGNITRRQQRSSTKADTSKEDGRKTDGTGLSSQRASASTKGENKITDDGPTDSPVNVTDDSMHILINQAPWQSTGVINNLPARTPSSRAQSAGRTGQAQRAEEMRRDTDGNRVLRPENVPEDMWKLHEAAEIGKAAEMALREVLGSFEAAKRKAEPQQFYDDFDFYSMNFPGLCLSLLDPPPALHSTTPFSVAHTWSIQPPGQQQADALTRVINERAFALRVGEPEGVLGSVGFRHVAHLQAAHENWKLLPEGEKGAAWNLEIMRALSREKERKQQVKAELESAQQRIRHLEAEYDRLAQCQLPRESLLEPPHTLPVSAVVMREMGSTDLRSSASEAQYSADALLDKWKRTVKATTRTHKSTPLQSHYGATRSNALKEDMLLNGSVYGVNGAMPRGIDQYGRIEERKTTYETPQTPGAVLDAEDEEMEEVDADADGEADDADAFTNHIGRGALQRFRGGNLSAHDPPVHESLNANGKRRSDFTFKERRRSPKVYRENPKA